MMTKMKNLMRMMKEELDQGNQRIVELQETVWLDQECLRKLVELRDHLEEDLIEVELQELLEHR